MKKNEKVITCVKLESFVVRAVDSRHHSVGLLKSVNRVSTFLPLPLRSALTVGLLDGLHGGRRVLYHEDIGSK